MKKRIAFAILGLLVIIGTLGGVKTLQIRDLIAAGESMAPPPTTVTAFDAQRTQWETTLSAIGTLEASQGVIITADLPGRVSQLYFDGGEVVAAGDLLLEQETSQEDAQMSAAESDLALAKSNLDRVSRLWQTRVVSRSEYDAARSEASAAQAQVDNMSSSLDKKQITAPFGGRLGLRLVDIGQDLLQGLPIVSLQAFDPMRVNFSLPQRSLAQVTEGLDVRITTNAVPDRVFTASITAINTEIDAATRTVRAQATLHDVADSDDSLPDLLPGMFVSVEVVLPDVKPVLMVPLTSISFATFGDSVFVLEPNEDDQLIARQQFIQLGERRGDFVEITKGLNEGDSVANEGVFKLRNGAPVKVNEGSSEPSTNPQPDNA